MQRRALTAALASATMTLGGALAATTVPAQAEDSAADPASPLVLEVPDTVTVRSTGGWIYSDLKIKMVAQNEDFEIQATRAASGDNGTWWDPAYDSPITATWKREGGNVDLGELTSWSGLDGFSRLQVFNAAGKRIRSVASYGCFNGSATKAGPAGPVDNPYPWGCPWNAYTLGSVMGVAQDYSVGLLSEYGTNLRLKPGRYRMQASITKRWRDVFGISPEAGIVESTLVVKKGRDNGGGWFEQARAVRSRLAAQGADDLEPTTEAPTADSAGAMAEGYAPDLRSLPAFDISVNEKGTALRFGATVWNGGNGPMVIEGFREPHGHDDARAARDGGDDHGAHMTAYQYYFDENGEQTGYDEVGEFNWHAGNHNHWHFRDFARYRLLNADLTEAVKSTKASFCLVATDAVDLTVPNADMRPEYTDLSSQCGGKRSQMLRQVLANGHGDTYHQFRTGQAFRLAGVADGIYYVAVEANPAGNLQELDDANNTSYRKIRLWTTPRGTRKVKVFKVGIIEETGFDLFRAMR